MESHGLQLHLARTCRQTLAGDADECNAFASSRPDTVDAMPTNRAPDVEIGHVNFGARRRGAPGKGSSRQRLARALVASRGALRSCASNPAEVAAREVLLRTGVAVGMQVIRDGKTLRSHARLGRRGFWLSLDVTCRHAAGQNSACRRERYELWGRERRRTNDLLRERRTEAVRQFGRQSCGKGGWTENCI